MKFASRNVNSLAVRLPQLLDWLALHQPDAMVLQETKLSEDHAPVWLVWMPPDAQGDNA